MTSIHEEDDVQTLQHTPSTKSASAKSASQQQVTNELYKGNSNAVPSYDLGALDEGARILLEAEGDEPVTQTEMDAVRKKIDWNLLPLMMLLYLVQFSDKTALGSSAILGIKEDNHLSTTQYNFLGTAFYISYLVFEWPQTLMLQRFPIGTVMSCNILLWSLFLLCHAACSSFAGLVIVRLGLGACEGAITAGFLLTTSQFYLVAEQNTRVSLWFLMNGTAQIVSGLLAYAAQFIHAGGWRPWRWFCIIFGLITLATALLYFAFFPNSPTTARFLNARERVVAVKRIQANQTGLENKRFKKEQFIEALCTPTIWLFAVFSLLNNIPNSLTNQRSIIIKSLGYSTLQSTLLGIPIGVIEIVSLLATAYFAAKWKNGLAFVSIISITPAIVGAALIIALPEDQQVGKLIALYFAGFNTPSFVLALSWCNTSITGHTKKTTANAVNLVAYALGNIIGPQIWLSQYAPRNIVPWSVIMACLVAITIILFIVRFLFARENARRDALVSAGRIDAHTDVDVNIDPAGSAAAGGEKGQIHAHLDTAFLDLTDRQNMAFRYPL